MSIFLLTNAFADVTIVLRNPTKNEMIARVKRMGCYVISDIHVCDFEPFVGVIHSVDYEHDDNETTFKLYKGFTKKGDVYRIVWTQWIPEKRERKTIVVHEFTVDDLNETLISEPTKMEIEHGKGKKNIR